MLKPVGDGFIQLKNKVMMLGSLENEPFVAVDFTGMMEYVASTLKKCAQFHAVLLYSSKKYGPWEWKPQAQHLPLFFKIITEVAFSNPPVHCMAFLD